VVMLRRCTVAAAEQRAAVPAGWLMTAGSGSQIGRPQAGEPKLAEQDRGLVPELRLGNSIVRDRDLSVFARTFLRTNGPESVAFSSA